MPELNPDQPPQQVAPLIIIPATAITIGAQPMPDGSTAVVVILSNAAAACQLALSVDEAQKVKGDLENAVRSALGLAVPDRRLVVPGQP